MPGSKASKTQEAITGLGRIINRNIDNERQAERVIRRTVDSD